jgi:hypothetical protein
MLYDVGSESHSYVCTVAGEEVAYYTFTLLVHSSIYSNYARTLYVCQCLRFDIPVLYSAMNNHRSSHRIVRYYTMGKCTPTFLTLPPLHGMDTLSKLLYSGTMDTLSKPLYSGTARLCGESDTIDTLTFS